MASRERAQGADEEDGDRSELPLPGKLSGWRWEK